MNKNNINFQVYRTKESTLVELLCLLLMLISLILSIILFFNVRQAGVGMLVQTGAVGLGVLLVLFFAYKPETFNIPDDSPARLFLVTVRFLRYAAVLMSLMSLGMTLSAVLGFTPTVVAASSALLFVPLLCWYFYEYMRVKRNKMRE